jgi:hypothetical protein
MPCAGRADSNASAPVAAPASKLEASAPAATAAQSAGADAGKAAPTAPAEPKADGNASESPFLPFQIFASLSRVEPVSVAPDMPTS